MTDRRSGALVAVVLAGALLAGCGGSAEKGTTAQQKPEAAMQHDTPAGANDIYAVDMIVCPVSGHKVPKSKAVKLDYQGREIYLCCNDCVEPFHAEPAKYLAKLDAAK